MNSIPNPIILLFIPFKVKILLSALMQCSTLMGFHVVSQKEYFVASLLLHSHPSTVGWIMGGSYFNVLYSPLHSQACWFCNNRMLSCSWTAFWIGSSSSYERYRFTHWIISSFNPTHSAILLIFQIKNLESFSYWVLRLTATTGAL